jgi:alkylation response protein AidB-like acyl-CoA dehydrogenase
MTNSEEQLVGDTLRAFRQKNIEPFWEKLDVPDAARYQALFSGLAEIGVTSLGLPEEESGLALSSSVRFDILHELGAAAPALAFALVSHASATSLLLLAAGGRLSSPLAEALVTDRFALASSPLDKAPASSFTLTSNGRLTIDGVARMGLAYPDFIVVPALDSRRVRLCVVRADAPGVTFAGAASSHGLRLVPFGELVFDHVTIRPDHVFDWPASGRCANEADGLVAALLTGIMSELASRAASYALERYQGGKLIHEHDAVQELVGPIELARRCMKAVALATLSGESPGDGGASAFAVELARKSGLDAIQTFGGYGYMEDYRVERYLRDANTLETCWIHASSRKRAIARDRFAAMRG